MLSLRNSSLNSPKKGLQSTPRGTKDCTEGTIDIYTKRGSPLKMHGKTAKKAEGRTQMDPFHARGGEDKLSKVQECWIKEKFTNF